MRVYFLNPSYLPGFCKSARWFAKSRGRVQRHPDYLCEAIAVAERDGHECRFLDAAAKDVPHEQLARSAREFKPELVVIQTTTPSIYSDIEAARQVKQAVPGVRTVLVGAHVTAEPDDTLSHAGETVDYVARGEYDLTVSELAAGRAPEEILGLSHRDEQGCIAHNADRPFIQDVDALPFPAWRHIDIADYRDAGKLYPFITLLGGRGCQGRCTFCLLPQVMYGQAYRPKSPERVLAEIAHDVELFPGLKEVMFEDDALSFPRFRDRLEAICEGIIARFPGLAWSANFRADVIDPALLKLMKRSGCRMLCVGFEFGDKGVLNRVRKGIKIETMRRFADAARRAGIRVHGCFMFGGPGETPETAQATIAFAKSLPIDTAQFSGVCTYPGTEYYRWVRDHGCLVPTDWTEWVDAEGEQRSVVNLPDLDVGEINAFVDRGLKEFYLRPRQMVRMALALRNWSDVRTKLYGLASFIDYFRSS